ncbi:MAG: tetratricopeptide repeat protein [Bacteroidales bacterium]|nr:tetratricopeptide repeat protein [Bacteroidales bacterium]
MPENNKFEQEIQFLNKEAWKIRFNDTKKSRKIAQKAYDLAVLHNYELGVNESLLCISVARFMLAENDEYILLDLIAVSEYFEKHTKDRNYIYSLKYTAEVYEKYGDLENAVKYCEKAVHAAEEFGCQEALADSYSLFGDIYVRMDDFKTALNYLQKALEIRKILENGYAIASSYNLIARTYRVSGSYADAFRYYEKALNYREDIDDFEGLIWTHIGLASTYAEVKKFESAEKHFFKSLKINEKFEDKRCQLYCNHGLGKIKTQSENYKEGLIYLQKALKIAEETNSKLYLFEIHLSLSNLYEKLNDDKKALNHYKLFHENKEDVLNNELQNRLKNQLVNFEIEKTKKEAEIYHLKNVELKEVNEQLSEKNTQITDSIRYAQKIQFALIHPINYLKNDLKDYFILFMPRDIVSGDFYWLNKIDNKIFVIAADCTGHGVPGAFMSILGISFLNEIININNIYESDLILNELRKNVKVALRQDDTNSFDGMDISLCVIDIEKKTLQYSGAFSPLILVRNNELQIYKGDRMPIGRYIADDKLFTKQEIKLKENDKFYIFSDGYTDQFGGENYEKFKLARFRDLILKVQNQTFIEQKQTFRNVFKDWKGDGMQFDDVIVVGFQPK